ncbi:unnamed protein product [Linum tenue]|uniref:Uncharacterized protein n=1 Tax=Linum tenue TaxID=586396 RepID=A0AAV0RUS5_9ROSI|nr:unnamed protein product [Linum tenue]
MMCQPRRGKRLWSELLSSMLLSPTSWPGCAARRMSELGYN